MQLGLPALRDDIAVNTSSGTHAPDLRGAPRLAEVLAAVGGLVSGVRQLHNVHSPQQVNSPVGPLGRGLMVDIISAVKHEAHMPPQLEGRSMSFAGLSPKWKIGACPAIRSRTASMPPRRAGSAGSSEIRIERKLTQFQGR